MIKKLTNWFLFAIAIVIFIFSFHSVSAQYTTDSGVTSSPSPTPIPTIDVAYESVNPTDGIAYPLKRIGEKISMFFAFSNESKVKNYKSLVNIRLAELKFIIENKKAGYFEKSTQRYFTAAGQLTLFITSKNIKSQYMSVKEQLLSQIPVLVKLRDTYDPSTAEWRFVEDDINYASGYADTLHPN